MYQELINDGAKIQDLLRGNSGNVGELGELLELAADTIDGIDKEAIVWALNKIKAFGAHDNTMQNALMFDRLMGMVMYE